MTFETTVDPTPEHADMDEFSRRRRLNDLSTDIADLMKDIVDRARELSAIGISASIWLPLVTEQLEQSMFLTSIVKRLESYIAPVIDATLAVTRNMTEAPNEHGGVTTKVKMEVEDVMDALKPSPFEDASMDIVDHVAARRAARAILSAGPAASTAEWVTKMSTDSEDLIALAGTFLDLQDGGMDTNAPSTHRINDTLDKLFKEAEGMELPAGLPKQQTPSILCNVVMRGLQQPLSGSLARTPQGGLKLLTPYGKPNQPPDGFYEQFFDVSDVLMVTLQREVKFEPTIIS